MPNRPSIHRPHGRQPRDADRRPAHERGYDHQWFLLRNRWIEQYPICQACEAEGIVTHQNLIVDHITPVDVAPHLRLSWENLQTLCRPHHKKKTDADKQRHSKTGSGTQPPPPGS